MLDKQRHQLILEILSERQYASVKDLTDQLNASEATIRRDINKLAENRQLLKIRGGAEALPGNSSGRKKKHHLAGSVFLADRERHTLQKRLIAKKAVELCQTGDSITINGGSSTYMMAEFLTNTNLSILTNSFELAHHLIENSENQVSLPGGEIYRKQSVIVSSFENDNIHNYYSTMIFMGTPGIGDFGVMESDPLLIRAEQKLKKQAERLVILADSSKLGKRSNFILCPLEDVDILITDSRAEPRYLSLFREHGIQVIIADENSQAESEQTDEALYSG